MQHIPCQLSIPRTSSRTPTLLTNYSLFLFLYLFIYLYLFFLIFIYLCLFVFIFIYFYFYLYIFIYLYLFIFIIVYLYLFLFIIVNWYKTRKFYQHIVHPWSSWLGGSWPLLFATGSWVRVSLEARTNERQLLRLVGWRSG